MLALVVIVAFQAYGKGALITDPDTIAAIEAGGYSDNVIRVILPGTGNGGEALTVTVTLSIVGQPITLAGQVFNSMPSALDYSTDGGNSWTPVFGFALAGGEWSGYGPSYISPGNFNILVRDHNAPLIASAPVGFTVLAVLHTGGGGDPFSIVNFGATAGVGNSGPDCSGALVAAFAAAAAAGEEVVIPGGDWWFASPVALGNAPVALRGHGKGQTRLHVSHSGIALAISQDSPLNRVVISDMTLMATNAAAPIACAISVTFPPQPSFGYQTAVIENVEVFGYPNAANGVAPFPQTWNRGIVLNNCWSAQVTNCSWFGPPAAAGATTACFIEVNGSTDTQITDALAYYGQALVIQTGYCQGLRMTAPRVVGTDYVFIQSPQATWTGYNAAAYSMQGLAIYGGELNTNIGHLQVAAMLGGFVASANITRRPQGPAAAQVLFNLTDTSDFHISNCDWNGGPGAADVALQFQLGVLGNGSGNSLQGGHFSNLATVLNIVGSNGTVGSVFRDFRCSNVATPVIDGSLASNGNLIYFAGAAGTDFPSGLISNKDFRWAGPDNTTLFRVQSTQGGANFWKVAAASAGNPPLLLAGGGDSQVNATIQTTGGNLYLSAAGDGVSGGLAAFTNLAGATAWPTFQNATTGNLVEIGTTAEGLAIAPAGQLYLGGAAVFSGVVGNTTANPGGGGNTNQLWNNGGAVSLAQVSGLLPTPTYHAITVGGVTVSMFGAGASASFGAVSGTIADGGALSAEMTARATGDMANTAAAAAAQATANAALPSIGGTLSGAVTFASGAGTLAAGTNLYLTPVNQLWLGAAAGTGAVYSATIAGVTSNPGTAALGKIWSNGGMLALAGAANPLPLMAPAFTMSQPYANVTGTAAIFSHNGGNVPTPPTALGGALIGDLFKLNGHYNFGWVWQPSDNYDCWPNLQNFLLYAQLMFLAQAGTSLANVAQRQCVDVHLPAGKYYVSQPLIVPEYVRFGGPGVILPTPYVGAQSGGSLVNGVFYSNVSTGIPGNFMPVVVVCPRAHLSDLNVNVAGATGSSYFKTSGVVFGKNWQPLAGASLTIGNPGTGYAVGDQVKFAEPSLAPFSPTVAVVTGIGGGASTGPITSIRVTSKALGDTATIQGDYALPPAACLYNGVADLQQQQWTAANGFSIFDPAYPGCFLTSNYGGGSGTGATIGVPSGSWRLDFVSGGAGYTTGAALTNGSQAGRIQITGAVPINYDTGGMYGPSYNVQWSGLEGEIESIQGLGGRTGLWCFTGQDLRIGRLNMVDTSTFAWFRYSGSIECPNCVADTCGQVLVIDQSHGIVMRGRAFFEEGNIRNTLPNVNVGVTQAGSNAPAGPFSVGAGSTTASPVTGCDIKFTVFNMGGLPASTIAAPPGYPANPALTGVTASTQPATCTIAYAVANRIELHVSNLSQYGATTGSPFPNPSPLPTSGLYQLGQNVDTSNVLLGTLDTVPPIDNVARPAQIVTLTSGHAYPACTVRVKDTQNGAWVNDLGICQIIGPGAPTNGATGAGFAAVGSTYMNEMNGTLYRNTGSLSSPSWTAFS